MRVMVTGGAGYIGSVITDQLVQDGHTVVVYDNLSKGHRDAVSERAIFVEADLLDERTLSETVARHDIDAVVHMAASSLVGESMIDPEKYYLNNVVASLGLLAVMKKRGVRNLVFSSTAAVYGEPERQPIAEHDPIRPSNTYGETKVAIERALHWHRRADDLRFVSLRYFNAAGATTTRAERHDPEMHLIPLVLRAARNPQGTVTVFGDDYPTRDGTCVRDYIHVSDLARAHVLALAALAAGEVREEIFNLGRGDGYTVKEVIEASQKITGRAIAVEVGARRTGDPAVLVASSEKISRMLGWAPQQGSLEEILSSAWQWETSFANRRDLDEKEARDAGYARR